MPGQGVSGVETLDDGTRRVRASVRPDGTVRREIKVRQGFVPAEDAKRYNVRERREARLREGKLRDPGGRENGESIKDRDDSAFGASTSKKEAASAHDKRESSEAELVTALEDLTLQSQSGEKRKGPGRDGGKGKSDTVSGVKEQLGKKGQLGKEGQKGQVQKSQVQKSQVQKGPVQKGPAQTTEAPTTEAQNNVEKPKGTAPSTLSSSKHATK